LLAGALEDCGGDLASLVGFFSPADRMTRRTVDTTALPTFDRYVESNG
jgi:hypothetical protein